jgi:hypothetical protein
MSKDLMRLQYIVAEIADACADIQTKCGIIQRDLHGNDAEAAVREIKEALRIARQVTILSNVVSGVIEAIDTAAIADGDVEAAEQSVGAVA